MVQQPERYVDDFVDAGADMVVIHAEFFYGAMNIIFIIFHAYVGRIN
jgi:pentose-5-phosphate-3-epimerase